MRHAAPDSQWRARAVAVLLALLGLIVAWILLGSNPTERASAQTGTCTGDGTATLTLTDGDNDGVAETSTDTVIPASCDIGLRTDGRTGRYWSIDVYNSADASKRYFCHRGTDAPPGEPSCDTPQPTNPTPDSDVSGAIVKENGIWRLYLHLNTRVPNHSLSVRAHYGWKGTGGETDQCPAEPGTGPCANPDPDPPAGSKYDLRVTLKTVFNLEPTDRFAPARFTVQNTQRAQTRSPAATLSISILATHGADYLGKVDLKQVKLGDAPLIDCAPRGDQFVDCTVPSLPVNTSLDVPLEIPATGERISLLGIVGAGGRPCREADEFTCSNNNTSEYKVNVPAPETRVEQPDLSNTGEIFKGTSSRSDSAQVMRVAAHTAATGPRVRRVEIALLRLRGKARAVATPRCLWLRNTKAGFRSVKAGARNRCDDPVWLRARGTKRWRFEGTEPLPKGRYVLYARAIDAAGHTTSRFLNRRGNRREFRVR